MKNEPKDPLERLWARASANLQGLDAAGRKRLWLGAAAALLLAGGIALLAGRVQWKVLYTGLQPRDAGAITDKLKAAKIPYRLTDGGAAIEIPAGDVYQQRLSLATQGLPEGQDKGYELLDGNSFMVSEETARVDRLRALQGELERTLLAMNGVAGVRVHLVVPQRQLFSGEAQSSSASVLLKLRDGFTLDGAQAAAITLLVSHAVEGLKPQNVALVDTQGRNLGGWGAGGEAVGSRVDATRAVEDELRGQVQSMLDEALGPGQAIVRVHAELNFDDKTVTKDLYEAPARGKQGLVSEETSDASTATRPAPNPAPATLSVNNPGGSPVSGQAAPPSGRSSSHRQVVYALDHTVESQAERAGGLKRVDVAVLLKRTYSAAELATLKQAVQETAGLDSTRGDALSLAVAPPAMAPPKTAPAQEKALLGEAATQRRLMLLETVGPWALTALAILVLGLLAFKALKLIFSLPPAAGLPYPGQAGAPPAAPRATEADMLKMVESNPASAAQVLRRMMNN